MAMNLKGGGHGPTESTFPAFFQRDMKTINVNQKREYCHRDSKFQRE
jgi:hypothetical protein